MRSAQRRRRPPRPERVHRVRWVAIAAIAVAFLVIPPLARAPGRLIAGCATWIVLAAGLELLSLVGFIVVFKLVFHERTSWRRTLGPGLRALGATTVLPAGGLVGPAIGARTGSTQGGPPTGLMRASIAFALLTNVPGLTVLGGLSVILWLGWLPGPHDADITLPAAGLAFGALAAALLLRRWPRSRRQPPADIRRRGALARFTAAGVRSARGGLDDACRLLASGNWKLAGAFGYYAFDNAVLWAAFRAYGRTPPPTVIVMGYLVGSFSTTVPLPAGIGAVEGGLIGALVLYGTPAAPAAAAVLLYRGVSLSLPLLLGGCAWAVPPAARLRMAIPRLRGRHGHTRRGARAAPRPSAASAD